MTQNNLHIINQQVCSESYRGCIGARDSDQLKYRCSDPLLPQICPGPEAMSQDYETKFRLGED